MRLLTEEVEKVIDNAKMADIVDGRFSSKPYAEEVVSITLKAVGGAIKDYTHNQISFERLAELLEINLYELDIAFRKRGEMPEEVK